jgi:hypothetical protein
MNTSLQRSSQNNVAGFFSLKKQYRSHLHEGYELFDAVQYDSTLFQNEPNMFTVHLSNTVRTHKEILHSQSQNTHRNTFFDSKFSIFKTCGVLRKKFTEMILKKSPKKCS